MNTSADVVLFSVSHFQHNESGKLTTISFLLFGETETKRRQLERSYTGNRFCHNTGSGFPPAAVCHGVFLDNKRFAPN